MSTAVLGANPPVEDMIIRLDVVQVSHGTRMQHLAFGPCFLLLSVPFLQDRWVPEDQDTVETEPKRVLIAAGATFSVLRVEHLDENRVRVDYSLDAGDAQRHLVSKEM